LKPLKPGDVIEIIAPGSHAPLSHLQKGAEILQSWGFKVIYSEDILKPHIFLSNSDKFRFESFKSAMTNKKSNAVWCLRGGYGSIRLLPEIEKMAVPKEKKLLIGLSDITSLQAVICQKWKFPTLHGALIDRLALEKLDEANISEIKSVLTSADFVMRFENLKPLNKAARSGKVIKAKVVGGNLMVVTSTLGTPSQLKTRGKIIFLEELCERSYRIDRCLQQMRQAGLFEQAAAVVFGDFTNCDEPNKDNYVEQVMMDFFREMKIPALSGVENGHGEKQRPLFFNTETHLTCEENGRMLVYSPFKD
jgi:muramoyltetrapeptide carboxypeptidase